MRKAFYKYSHIADLLRESTLASLGDSPKAHPLQLPCSSLNYSCRGFYGSRQNPKSSPVASCLLQKVAKATLVCFHAEFLEISSLSNAGHAWAHPLLVCVPAEHLFLLGLSSKAKRVCRIQPGFKGEPAVSRDCSLRVPWLWNALAHWSQTAWIWLHGFGISEWISVINFG